MVKLKDVYPLYLNNKAEQPNADLEVTDKYTGEIAFRVAQADAKTIDAGIRGAVEAAEPMARMPSYQRQAVLQHCVDRFRERFDELAYALCVEAGKPIKDSEGEVTRLIDTFRIAAEESVRMTGEVQPLDISPRAKGYQGIWKRVPIGPCSFISPFNFPLNLAAHKIAPALAVGCPFVMKPASRTPLGAIIMGEVLAETDLPKGAFSILPAHREGADLFTTDERLKLLSFTGSPAVGWDLKARAGKKKVVLELGGNAAVIIDRDADLDDALDPDHLRRLLPVRPVLHRRAADPDPRRSLRPLPRHAGRKTKSLVAGDPKDRDVFIGPMISEGEASRLDQWIQEAVAKGAKLLCGGKREGAMLEATLLEDVDPATKLNREEAFGPVAFLIRFSDFNRRSTWSTTASSASRPASSPATSSRCSTPGTGSTSAAS
jgi:acyl-CoA reductase-like NAD-dependent aldehyde dehydrogenase